MICASLPKMYGGQAWFLIEALLNLLAVRKNTQF